MIVHLLNLFVEGFKGRIGIGSFAEQDDAGDDVIIVDDLPVFAVDGASELTQPYLRTLRNHGNISHAKRRSVLGEDDSLLNVMNLIDQSDLADIDLLQAFLNEAAAGIRIVVAELLFDLGEA